MTEASSLESISKRLGEAATRLNAASDEFSRQIDAIDEGLSRLNIGIGAWQPCDDGSFLSVGYVRTGKRWGLAIKRQEPTTTEEFWLYNAAPRASRIHALPFILPLLENALLAKMDELTVRLHAAHKLALEYIAGVERFEREQKGLE
jgi:hypothetical protein